jgi:hypothetical protein
VSLAQMRLHRLRLVIHLTAVRAGVRRGGRRSPTATTASCQRGLGVVLIRQQRPPLRLHLLLQAAVLLGEALQHRFSLLHGGLLGRHAIIQSHIHLCQHLLGVDEVLNHNLAELKEVKNVFWREESGFVARDTREGDVLHDALQCLDVGGLHQPLDIDGDKNAPVEPLVALHKRKFAARHVGSRKKSSSSLLSLFRSVALSGTSYSMTSAALCVGANAGKEPWKEERAVLFSLARIQ